MRLTHLSLKDYRGIAHAELPFANCRTIVLIGANGGGKTTALEAIATAMSWFVGRVRRAAGKGSTIAERDIRNGAHFAAIEVEVRIGRSRYKWTLARTRAGRHVPGQSEMEGVRQCAEYLRARLADHARASLPLVVYYPVHRAVLAIPLRIRTRHNFEQLDGYERALQGGADFRLFFEWFREREDAENEERVRNPAYRDTQLEAVRRAVASLLPEFRGLRIRRRPSLRMEITRRTAGQQEELLAVDQLSQGEKTLLALTGDLARRLAIMNPDLSDPLRGAGLVLIDEIELHLHPAWQRAVIPALATTFPRCQFIITTHSPQVISELEDARVFALCAGSAEPVLAVPPTYGLESGRLLEDVMQTPARPKKVRDRLAELFRMIERREYDDAERFMEQLPASLKENEPELTRARLLLNRLRMLHEGNHQGKRAH